MSQDNSRNLIEVQHLTKSFVADTDFFGRPTSFVQAVDEGWMSFFVFIFW